MVNRSKEKEVERETVDRKRRKSSSGTIEPPTTKVKEDVYTVAVKFEEQESRHRSADKDSELFHESCEKLRKIFVQIIELKELELKKDTTEKARQELSDKISEKRTEALFLFVLLKKLNRLDKVRLRNGRDALQKEKLNVDSNHLQLQNLLYEAEHLRKEVQRSLQFKSQDVEIDLVSEAEFYAQAPETIARPDKTKTDEHARRLARLEWELQQRKELAALCTELQSTKETVAADIDTKTDRLNSLVPRLEELLKATRPLQDVLNMDFEKNWKVQKIVRLLPKPLYLVYMNLTAYSEACDSLLTVTIQGDEEEAKQLDNSDKNSKAELTEGSQESDDEANDDNDQPAKSHHHRRQSKSTWIELKKNNLFVAHPLNVSFAIKVKNSDASLIISIFYLTALDLVTINCDISNIPEQGVVSGEVISPQIILNNLISNDIGDETPNTKTKFQLQELSIESNDFLNILYEKNLGKPYKWAQQLCGLEFIYAINDLNDLSLDLTQSTIPDIVKKIRNRWQSRLSLYKQIFTLENKQLMAQDADLLALRVVSSLQKWISLSWEEYSANPATNILIEENIATPHDLYYQATIVNRSARLDCFVFVSSNFPTELPLWTLQLNWKGVHNSRNDSSLREMEFWINSTPKPKCVDNIFGNQLCRVLTCLDIYLETLELDDASEFPIEKTFLKAFRSRTCSRPYKMIKNTGSVIYTQI